MEFIENKLGYENRISAKANLELIPEFSATLGAAFGTYLKNKGVIVLGRDYRTDCRMLKRSFAAGLMSAGVNVLDIHAAATPLLRFTIRRFGASGGVMFTVAHSQDEKITVKFFDSHGIEYGTDFILNLSNIMKKGINRVKFLGEIGSISTSEDIGTIYHKAMIQFIDKNLISNSNLKIVMDCANGPIGQLAPSMFSNLDIDIIAINSFVPYKSTKILPDIKSIRKLSRIITSADADFGVAFDIDADRICFFDETGTPIDSDTLCTLFLMDLISKNVKGVKVITSKSTSKILEEISRENDITLLRVENIPGEISNSIRLQMASLGISDSGKIRFPIYAPFTDTVLVILKLIEMICKSGEKLSSLLAQCPQSIKIQEDLNVKNSVFYNYYKILKEKIDPTYKVIDTLTGVKVFFGEDKGFINVTPQLYFDRLKLSGELVKGVDASELFDIIKNALKT